MANPPSRLHPIRATLHAPSRIASSTRNFIRVHHLAQIPGRFLVTPVTIFTNWLSLHTHIAYGVLFAGAYFETLVGPSFFIPGEIFLFSGSILAGAHVLNIWLVCLALYAGGILGDSSSYWIGRWLDKSIFHERKRILNLKNYKRIEAFLDKYGPKAIFLARLVGPFSKLAPVLAGVFEIPYGTFLLYNIPGIFISVSEYIVVGYFFGDRYELVFWWIERYFLLFFFILALGIFGYWYWKRSK